MQDRTIRSTRHHDDGTDMWSMTAVAPDPAVAGHVGGYTGYVERTTSFTARRELAGRTGVMIWVLGDPLSIIGADGREIVLRAGQAFVGGIADRTSISRALGPQQGIHVHMPIASLAAVCGAPAAEIANRCVPLDDMIGRLAREMGEALVESNDDARRYALLDAFMAARLADRREGDRAVAHAAAQLGAPDPPKVEALAREIGWSRKHLAARFAAETGFSPQGYRRLARFERFAAAIAAQPDEGLATLAVDAGYADQPHLTREVRAFAAMSPGELRRKLIPGDGGVRAD